MKDITLSVLSGQFTVHRFAHDAVIPTDVLRAEFVSITRTSEELSIVAPSNFVLDGNHSEPGWSCIKVLGPLSFAEVGILADIAAVLAEEKISIFTMSTYDTDYVLLKSALLEPAIVALAERCRIA